MFKSYKYIPQVLVPSACQARERKAWDVLKNGKACIAHL